MERQQYMVRTDRAGVFAGEMVERDGTHIVMRNARRIWYWSGAASLSQLATEGTSNPSACKFPAPVPEIELFGVIEIIPMSDRAAESIGKVAVWRV
jgi:hypothetical protein